MGYEGQGGKVVGTVPAGVTMPGVPTGLSWDVLVQLITTAVIISIIGFMEAISIAKAMAARTRQRLDPNQELIGQGLGNLVSGIFQGYAVSGSFSRSAVNINAGAVTGFSAVVTGLAVGATLLFLTPLLYHLPQATLAAVIMMAVINLVKIEPIIYAWRVQPHDGIVAIVTFGLTLIVAPHLETGIVTGVLLSLGLAVTRPGWYLARCRSQAAGHLR
jgi:SulP family sulfate permease